MSADCSRAEADLRQEDGSYLNECSPGAATSGKNVWVSRTLLLLRHAKSDWSHPGLSDRERPLNKRGLHDAPRMGRLLVEQNLVPHVILSSDAVRARQTCEALVSSSGFRGELRYSGRLYLAEPETYLDALSEVAKCVPCVLLVGHNPGISNLVALLTGNTCEMPTAALCQLRLAVDAFEEVKATSSAEIAGFWRPKDLE